MRAMPRRTAGLGGGAGGASTTGGGAITTGSTGGVGVTTEMTGSVGVVGTGSVGTRDYIVLLFGNGPDDPLFLQVKEELPSCYVPHLPHAPTFEHEGKRVVLICHAASILAYLSDVMRLEPGSLRLLPYYTSISTVRVLGDRRMVGALGDTGHLQ